MIALAALPQKWENQITIITQNIKLADLDLNDVWDLIVAQYKTETNCVLRSTQCSIQKMKTHFYEGIESL